MFTGYRRRCYISRHALHVISMGTSKWTHRSLGYRVSYTSPHLKLFLISKLFQLCWNSPRNSGIHANGRSFGRQFRLGVGVLRHGWLECHLAILMGLADSGQSQQAAVDQPRGTHNDHVFAEPGGSECARRWWWPWRWPQQVSCAVEEAVGLCSLLGHSYCAHLQQLGLVHVADRVALLHEAGAQVQHQGECCRHCHSFLHNVVVQHGSEQDTGYAESAWSQHDSCSEDSHPDRLRSSHVLFVGPVLHWLQSRSCCWSDGHRHHGHWSHVLRIPG